MSEKTLSFREIWERLTLPHEGITDIKKRRQMQALSVLSLGLFLILTPLTVLSVGIAGRFHFSASIFPVMLFAAYTLSRTRYPEVGAWILVTGLSAASFAAVLTSSNMDLIPVTLIFLLAPILLATLILEARATLIIAIITVMMLTFLPVIHKVVTFDQILLPYIAILFLTVLATVSAFLRERDISVIQDQTQDLATYSQNLEKDVEIIQTMAEVGRTITATRDLESLLKQIVDLIINRFDYYHAQVFLIDDAHEYAVLTESTGTAGEELKARGHRLAVGSQSVIGQVTATGQAVIASDTDVDAVHRRNELLPHTRSEMALPLKVSGKTIGALDIQSVNPNAFQDTTVSVLQTMADQLAIAIENARLFERAQRDLNDIEVLNRQLTGDAWGRFMKSRSKVAAVGYQAKDGFVKPVAADNVESENETLSEGTISLPLTVRGETIGVLDVMSKSGKKPDEETQNMLEAVAERVALALDSARLGEQAQRQASRDQILSTLSAELQATTDLDTILQITAREVSRALNTSRGFVHLKAEFRADAGSSETATG